MGSCDPPLPYLGMISGMKDNEKEASLKEFGESKFSPQISHPAKLSFVARILIYARAQKVHHPHASLENKLFKAQLKRTAR